MRTWFIISLVLVAASLLAVRAVAQTDAPADTPQQTSEPRTQDNIVVVLDASGSMREKMRGSRKSRMDTAKEALIQVLEKTPATTNVGIVVFSGRSKTGDWIVPLGPLNIAQVKAALAPITPDGGTPLGQYMKIGADALLEQRRKQLGYGTFRLLLMTDGEASDGKLVDVHLPDVLRRGLQVDVIGMDMKSGNSLAKRVNTYRPADSAAELATALQQTFAEIGGSGKDATDPEAFAMAGAFAPDAAAGLLAQLKQSSNEPIGSAPAATAASPAQSGAQSPPPAASPGASQQSQAPAGTPSGSQGGSSFFNSTIGAACCVASIFGMIFIAKVIKRSAHGGRR